MNYSEFEKLTAEFNNSLIWEVQKDNTHLISNWRIRPFSEFTSIYKNMIYLVKTTDREVKLFTSKPTKVKRHFLVDSGEERYYHRHFYKVPSKEYFECWEDAKGGYGIRFDISNFSDEIIKQLEYDKVLVII